MNFGEKVIEFYRGLQIDEALPDDVRVMNPYQDPAAMEVCSAFYQKFYKDNFRRYLILGINPGRYGAGITGIPFTDPIKLEKRFGIPNNFAKKAELSADFIHMMIETYGGAGKFFRKFFINSISPLGFVRAGKNINYYDVPALKESLRPFICLSLQRMLKLNIDRNIVFCLGEGTNYKYLVTLNEEMRIFKQVIPLAHPRFIMQYRRKQLDTYLQDYIQKLDSAKDLQK